jgi:predicted secreted protein
MKSRIIIMIAMCAALLLSLSCTMTPSRILAVDVEISCEKFNAAQHYMSEFEAEVDTVITVSLCSNPSTGYEWECEITGEDVLEETGHDYVPPEGEAVGAPGMDVWTFKAIGEGEAEVRLEYSQPWEDGDKEERTYTFTVTVD